MTRTLSVIASAILLALPVSTVIAQQENGPAAIRNSPPPVSAADSALEARTSAVASTLRCPVCQGLSIQDSPSELSQQMRAVVRDQLRAGKTPGEIQDYFVSKYGEWILLEPKPAGFNMLVYVMPLALVAAGLAGILIAVRRWSRPPVAETTSATPVLTSTETGAPQ